MRAPEVGDQQQLTPRQHLKRQAKRYAAASLAFNMRVGRITAEEVEAEEDAFFALALAYATDEALKGGVR